MARTVKSLSGPFTKGIASLLLGRQRGSRTGLCRTENHLSSKRELGVQFGGKKYLWGNIPALDVLQLGLNEGFNYGRPLSLLFAGAYGLTCLNSSQLSLKLIRCVAL